MDNNKLLLPMSIIIAGVIIAGAVVYNPDSKAEFGEVGALTGEPVVLTGEAPTIDDDVILGEADAPVTVIIFGDYECPFCERLYQETEKQMREEYVTTGKVRVVYRDYPLPFHPSAQPAAEAAECAGAQGKYWAYHDALFERQATISTMNYVDLAGELGLDKIVFKTCVDTNQFADEVAKDYADGDAAGVEGTPATFINGRLISGAMPYATFKAAIEAALAQ
ncbi:MAG: DsbA family protein [bacterium]|nr:DsbA family protein [bacterium]